MWLRRNSKSSQKPVPTNNDVGQILGSLHALPEDIYVILEQRVDQKKSFEDKCAAIYDGISDLLLESELEEQHLTSAMLNIVQSSKTELESLNFSRTKDKNRENIFSGYLLRQRLIRFFNQSTNIQEFSRNTQILLTTLEKFFKEKSNKGNDQLIESMMVLINSVMTTNDQETLAKLSFPRYSLHGSKHCPIGLVTVDLSLILSEIVTRVGDIKQLFELVKNLQVEDSVKFRILKAIWNPLNNQFCEDPLSILARLLNSDSSVEDVKKVREEEYEKIKQLYQQFDVKVKEMGSTLRSFEMKHGKVCECASEVAELKEQLAAFQEEQSVTDGKKDNCLSLSILGLFEKQHQMENKVSEASRLSKRIGKVLEQVLDKEIKRNRQLEVITQMNLREKMQRLNEFNSELEELSKQANINDELKEQVTALLVELPPYCKKYLNGELHKMNCADVKSNLNSLKGLVRKFKEMERNIIKLKKAIRHKLKLKQIMQQTQRLCDRTKFLLEKLEKVQQKLVGFIVDELKQIETNLKKYKKASTSIEFKGKKENKIFADVLEVHKQKIKTLQQSIDVIGSLQESNDTCILSVAIERYNKVIGNLESNVDDGASDLSDEDEANRIAGQRERFKKFWSIEIERLKKIQEYLQILNIDSEKINGLVSQLSALENWLRDNKSFLDSKVDFNSDKFCIDTIRQGRENVNQTKEYLNLMKEFLKKAIEKIKQKIDDLQREYVERCNTIKFKEEQRISEINILSKDLKLLLCLKLRQTQNELQIEGESLSGPDCQFLDSIKRLLTEESDLLFVKCVNKIREATSAHNTEVAGIVNRIVATHEDTYNNSLESVNEETKRQCNRLCTELYVIETQRKQSIEILKILQRNLSDVSNVIDFADCERFLQNHEQALKKPEVPQPPPPEEEECDKTSMCSLM